jgi:hypothetical protein
MAKHRSLDQLDLFSEPEAEKPVKTGPFDEGGPLCIPRHFPTCGGRPQDADGANAALERQDAEALKRLKHRWFCHRCGQWHEFSDLFFREFKGVYPHEMTMHGDWRNRG